MNTGNEVLTDPRTLNVDVFNYKTVRCFLPCNFFPPMPPPQKEEEYGRWIAFFPQPIRIPLAAMALKRRVAQSSSPLPSRLAVCGGANEERRRGKRRGGLTTAAAEEEGGGRRAEGGGEGNSSSSSPPLSSSIRPFPVS